MVFLFHWDHHNKHKIGWVKGRLTLDDDLDNTEFNKVKNDNHHTLDLGVAGKKIQLVNAQGHVVAETHTNSHGEYQFDVPAGQYRVKFPQLDGFNFAKKDVGYYKTDSDANANGLTDLFYLHGGEAKKNIDASLQPVPSTGWVKGRVTFDDDRDNTEVNTVKNDNRDEYDRGLAHVTVKLLDLHGNTVASTKTNHRGEYQFDVPAGEYRVKFDKPNGKFFSQKDVGVEHADSDADANGLTDIIKINAGQMITDIDASLQKTPPKGWVKGRVTFDDDRDNTEVNTVKNDNRDEYDRGLAHVTVKLLDLHGNTVASTKTNHRGEYQFDVPAGEYRVKFDKPKGKFFSQKDVGVEHADSDADANGLTDIIKINSGQMITDIDASLQKTLPKGWVMGRVTFDDDRDNTEVNTIKNDNSHPFDIGIAGVTVQLLDDAGKVVATKKTGADGGYQFDVPAGEYRLKVVAPDGKVFADKDVGPAGEDSDANSNGVTDPFTLKSGQKLNNVDVSLQDAPKEPPIVDELCTFRLLNHPDGAVADPGYGLRLDNLLGDGIFTFDFEAPGAEMFITVDGSTIRIFGTAVGGKDVGDVREDTALYKIDYTYNNVEQAAHDNDLIVAASNAMTNSGVITKLDSNGNPVQSFDLTDKAGTNAFSFRFGDGDNDAGHRGFEGKSGWGWHLVDGQDKPGAQDWLFAVGEKVEPNKPPVAADDMVETPEDTMVVIDVLGNDNDPDGDKLTVTKAEADQGEVSINADGTLKYTPPANFNGKASITYMISDGAGGVDTATVMVTVGAVNDAPVAADDVAMVAEDAMVVIPVLDNDSDPDGDDLSVTEATAQNGAVTINGDGTLKYTPNADFNGEDVISYTITDGNGGFDSAEVKVTVKPVNDAPVAADDMVETPEDTMVVIDVLGNDSDPDGDKLTVTKAEADQGEVSINADGTLKYTPPANFNGKASITYMISDGAGGVDTATVMVTVGAVNDAPVAADDVAMVAEDAMVVIPVLDNDSDPDGDDLSVTEATAQNGAVTINDDGTLKYTPNADFNGEDVISYTITDGNGGFDSAEVKVTVKPVNDAPVAADDMVETPEDTMVVIDVLGNDSDPDGDKLTVTKAEADQGEVSINADGTLKYTPPANFNGKASITYMISDGAGGVDTATVMVTVGAVNDAPVAADDVAMVAEDAMVVIPVLDNDSDPDGDDLSVTEASAQNGAVTINGDGTLKYTPNADFNGEDVISYTITDGNGGFDSAEVKVTVKPVNDAPVAADDMVETPEDTMVVIDVLGNDSDPDGDKLTVTKAEADQGEVSINADGTLKYTPPANFNGKASITYMISDGAGGVDTATVMVTVGAVNDAPVAADDVAMVAEDAMVVIPVLDNDSDPDGDDLSVTEASAQNGAVTINDDGTLKYTPNADFNGEDVISYTITDGNGGFDSAEVKVTVKPVNDAPVAADDMVETPEDTMVVIDVLGNDNDPDGDKLTVTKAEADQGEVSINADGTLKYTPPANFNGKASITYMISDGAGGVDTATVMVTVGAVNDAPVAADDVAMVAEDAMVVIPVLDNDSDPDGDDLSVTEASAQNGAVTINDDGTLKYTPNADFNGEDVISYTITDGNGGFDSAEVKVTVKPVDDNGAIFGRYFLDENRDGVDGSEAGVAGKTVKLISADGAVIDTKHTASDGSYRFDDVAPGDYVVMFEDSAAEGRKFVKPNVGVDDAIDSDVVTADGMTETVTVGDGAMVGDVDAGVVDKCVTDIIDFEVFHTGQIVEQVTLEDVMVVIDVQGDARHDGNSRDNDAMIFDTSNPTGDDEDLRTESQGKVLILTEDDDSTDPDDNAFGGVIDFEFSEDINVDSLVLIDVNAGTMIVGRDANGQQVDSVTVDALEDGQVSTIELNFENIRELELIFTGSGAVDDIVLSKCDEDMLLH